MRITTALIESFSPCKPRLDNYKLHYPNSNLSLVEFLKLDKISYSDKIWVWRHVAEKKDAVSFSRACANSVKHLDSELSNLSCKNADKVETFESDSASADYAQWTASYALDTKEITEVDIINILIGIYEHK